MRENTNVSVEENIKHLDEEVKRVKSLEVSNNHKYEFESILSNKAKKVLDDIEKNHNNAYAVYMYLRNKSSNSMDKTAIFYRGNNISYKEMYSKAFEYAKSLKAMGVKKGDEVPVCVNNIPEYVYLRMACSFIGATLHMLGPWFNQDYLKEILNNTGSDIMFVSDDNYYKIKNVIDESNIKNPIVISITDSLKKDKNNHPYNPYEVLDRSFHSFENKVNEIKKNSLKEIINQEEFLLAGRNYKGNVLENTTLDDVSSITYTSGTTKPGCPKGVKQSNRSYITFARFKSSDVSEMPEMKNMRALNIIPPYAHTQLSGLSDVLFCNCTFCCEPFPSKEFFPYSLLINKPNYCPSPVGFWIHLGKEFRNNELFKDINMPYLMLPEVVGEELSPGEEKFLNKIAREHKFGVEKLPFPLSPVTFSIGGGTTEGGGLFTTLYRSLQEIKPKYYNKNYKLGLYPLKLSEVEVLNQDLEYCKLNEPGLLVVNSPGNMMGYTNDEDNKTIYITDAHGKKWLNMVTLAYKSDPSGSIKMKGRFDDYTHLQDGSIFPYFKIEESVSKDTKNIMSCTVVRNPNNDIVIHIEPQLDTKKSINSIINSAAIRLSKEIPEEILSQIYFRFRDNEESFDMASSGKRNYSTLRNEMDYNKLISYEDALKLEENKNQNSILRLKK
ncbi:MAG: AMP-binding protein [Bacilli bacterium]